MKLKTLRVDGFKTLQDFELTFSNSNATVLIGTNGSGKSNVIEAISKVFRDALCFMKKVPDPKKEYEYSCEYDVDDTFSKITKSIKKRKNKIMGPEVVREGKLPSKVVCVYSGEEKRLWHDSFEEVYMDYIKCVKEHQITVQQLIYLNHYHWALCLLVMAIYMDEQYKQIDLPAINSVTFSFASRDTSKWEKNTVLEMLSIIGYVEGDRKTFSFEEIARLLKENYQDKEEILNLLMLATLPKEDKLINDIEFSFNNGADLVSLSEGEKKLIILNAVYEIFADRDTLVLLDEPDTYLHDGRKKEVYRLVKKYCDMGICSVITTHSPTLINLFDDNEIRMLAVENGRTEIKDLEKSKQINLLFDGEWTYSNTISLMASNKPILLFEGKSDIAYYIHALNILSEQNSDYKLLDFNVLSMGGAGNAPEFIEALREIVGGEIKVIAVFDRDDAGAGAIKKIIGIESLDIANFDKRESCNNVCCMLPKVASITGKEFCMEDYFDKTIHNRIIDNEMQNSANNSSLTYPKDLIKIVKKKIFDNYSTYDDSEFDGFKVLLDKLLSINSNIVR